MSTALPPAVPSGPLEPDDLPAAVEAHARWLADPDSEGARRAVFDGRVFPDGADLTRADLSGASFVAATLRGARLTGTTLIGADLSRADLSRADLSGANLTEALLAEADLSDAKLPSALLAAVRAPRSRWVSADLSDANLYAADLTSADLTAARLRRARVVRADLTDSRMSGADCYEADFHFASLRGVTAAGAEFREAALTGTDRTGADFTGATLEPGWLGWARRAIGLGGSLSGTLAELGKVVAGSAAGRVLVEIGRWPEVRGPMPGPVPAAIRSAKQEFSKRHFRERPMPLSGLPYLLAPPTSEWSRNLVGIGIGEKTRAGRGTRDWAVVFFVRHKLPPERVSADHRLPHELDGMPTDVVEAGVFRLHAPGPGAGVSADQLPGNPPQMPGWGTLGTLVRIKPAAGPVHLLSAAHVLTDNQRQPGPGTPIYIPPVGMPGYASAATLRKTYWADRPRAATNDSVTVDAGVAELDPDIDDATLRTVPGLPSGTAAAAVGTAVEKLGLNGRTDGTVAFIDTDVKNFLTPNPHAVYLNQVLIRPQNATAPFSQAGDSGALILTPEERAAVALLVGESFDGTERLTFAGPIEDVLTALDAELITR